MNLLNFVEQHRKMKIVIIFILIHLKRRTKNAKFVLKQIQIRLKNVYQKQILFNKIDMLFKINNEEEQAAFKKLTESEPGVKQLRLEEKFGKQDFHYDASDLLEPKTQTVKRYKSNNN